MEAPSYLGNNNFLDVGTANTIEVLQQTVGLLNWKSDDLILGIDVNCTTNARQFRKLIATTAPVQVVHIRIPIQAHMSQTSAVGQKLLNGRLAKGSIRQFQFTKGWESTFFVKWLQRWVSKIFACLQFQNLAEDEKKWRMRTFQEEWKAEKSIITKKKNSLVGIVMLHCLSIYTAFGR